MTHPGARQGEIARDARRMSVASYLIAGVTDQTTIANFLKVNRSTISRDIAVIEEQWRAERVEMIATEKGKDIARLERLIGAHWQLALKGNPANTNMILKALRQRAQLLGLDEAMQFNVTHSTLDRDQVEQISRQYGIDPDEVIAEAERHLAAVKAST